MVWIFNICVRRIKYSFVKGGTIKMKDEINYKEKILQTAKKSIENKVRYLTKQKDNLQLKIDDINEKIKVEEIKIKQLT